MKYRTSARKDESIKQNSLFRTCPTDLSCNTLQTLERRRNREVFFFSVGQANSKEYILLVKLFQQKFLPAKIFFILAKHPESCQNFCEAALHKTAACKMDRCVVPTSSQTERNFDK